MNRQRESEGDHYVLSKDAKDRIMNDTETDEMSMSIHNQLTELNLKSASKNESSQHKILSPTSSRKLANANKQSTDSEDTYVKHPIQAKKRNFNQRQQLEPKLEN